jgi:hypothetical protein
MAITSIKTGSSFTNLIKYNDFLGPNPAFIPKPVVTGGTLTSDATYYYRTFTASGTLGISGGTLNFDYAVVGGGGGGGGASYFAGCFADNASQGAGGGAGGVLTGSTSGSSNVTVTVGAGAAQTCSSSLDGNDSTLGAFTAIKGGRGGEVTAPVGTYGSSGGGGVTGSTIPSTQLGSVRAATSGQGFAGGTPAGNGINIAAGGGGGANAVGSNATCGSPSRGGQGGAGRSIFGLLVVGGGGGGGAQNGGAAGGNGGGGNAGNNSRGAAGSVNTGGGGGGGARTYNNQTPTGTSAGGSGRVVVRYTRSQVD